MILKTMINSLKGTPVHKQLSNDTLITLSQIESGCLFISAGNEAFMIIKSTRNEIRELKKLNRITLDIELIERPEFPTIAVYVRIHTSHNRSYDFEYYFNTEASEEMGLLEKLSAQKNIDILLYNDTIVHSEKIELTKEDKSRIASLLGEAKG